VTDGPHPVADGAHRAIDGLVVVVDGHPVRLEDQRPLAALRAYFSGSWSVEGPPRARLQLRNESSPPESSTDAGSTRAKGPFARTRDERRLREIVETVGYWAADSLVCWPEPLHLDESRIAEVDEAWVPVITPDGPGVLVWPTSG
jgi:hypothetical protein